MNRLVFTVEERDRVRGRVLEMARADKRIVAGAMVGSLALWQAEYWISGVRDQALSLACLRLGLPPSYGRGYDDLPEATKAPFADALVRSLDRHELLRALGCAIDTLLRESHEVRAMAAKLEMRFAASRRLAGPKASRPAGKCGSRPAAGRPRNEDPRPSRRVSAMASFPPNGGHPDHRLDLAPA